MEQSYWHCLSNQILINSLSKNIEDVLVTQLGCITKLCCSLGSEHTVSTCCSGHAITPAMLMNSTWNQIFSQDLIIYAKTQTSVSIWIYANFLWSLINGKLIWIPKNYFKIIFFMILSSNHLVCISILYTYVPEVMLVFPGGKKRKCVLKRPIYRLMARKKIVPIQ